MTRAQEAPGHERITYLVANYNRGAYLAECLESLRRQTCDCWKALVCDDGSTDDSVARVQPFLADDRIRFLVNPRNVGYTRTLIRLLDEADTDIVGILDPDDALTPEATERVLAAYAADPARGFVYTKRAVCNEKLVELGDVAGHSIPPGGSALRFGGVGALRTFRRCVYGCTAGLDPDFDCAEDKDLIYKLEEVATPVFVDHVLYLRRVLADSQSHDPVKREVGAKNHFRARSIALRRRGIGGAGGGFWRLVFACEYLLYSRRVPASGKALLQLLRKILARLEDRAPQPVPQRLA